MAMYDTSNYTYQRGRRASRGIADGLARRERQLGHPGSKPVAIDEQAKPRDGTLSDGQSHTNSEDYHAG